MTGAAHGMPCWYELSAASLEGAKAFYSKALGWSVADSGTPGMQYWLATAGDDMVAGMMTAEAGQPLGWTPYFTVTSCDDSSTLAASLGATVIVPPADIPDTGRFSILIDPQGAGFGLLQPLPGGMGRAFDQQKPGHGNWHEVICADPLAAVAFYGKLFGWTMAQEMQMGPDMTYRILACNDVQVGGTFAPSPPAPAYWKVYFGVPSVKAAMQTVTAAGGRVLRGPDEVPGGAFTVQIEDAQGARLALVGGA